VIYSRLSVIGVAAVLWSSLGAVRAVGADAGPPQVLVPAATYVRGIRAIRDKDRFEIRVDAFLIDQDEVTEGAYAACLVAKKCRKPTVSSKELNYPVRGVSWNDADAYCAFVGRRLPTEAEWERVAFPPSKRQKGSGPLQYTKEPCVALFIGGVDGESCGHHFTEPEDVILAQRKQRPDDVFYDWNLVDDDHMVFDLFGNVAEWVSDWHGPPDDPDGYDNPTTKTNPKGPATGFARVIKGGSFAAKRGIGEGDRRSEPPNARPRDVGFRCAADVNPR
jgi:formylglycine-generating enzyme required for sulfatase activity